MPAFESLRAARRRDVGGGSVLYRESRGCGARLGLRLGMTRKLTQGRRTVDKAQVMAMIEDLAPELADRARASDDPVRAILEAWRDARRWPVDRNADAAD